jgi:arylsulfatase A-like enzyme
VKARQIQGGLFLASIVMALAAGLLTSCTAEDTALREPARRPNVILISIDTLRPDHLGCYGYDRDTSPALDALCEEAVVFEETIAQAPSTLHSHASMFTSLLPHHHQATWAGKTRIPEPAITLAEVFQQAGYRTAAFTGGGQMDRVFGLDQGFELYEQPSAQRFEDTVWKGVEWLEADDDRPFFLFLHSYEVHHPYTPRSEYLGYFDDDYSGALPSEISLEVLGQINRGEISFDEADLRHVIAAYDAEIRSADVGLANLLRYLENHDLYEDTMIVFTSDHGEEFGEHGKVGLHSHTLFDELLWVPLVIRFPGSEFAGERVDQQVRSIDIPPTIAAAVGLPVPEQFSGIDLRELLSSKAVGELVAVSRLDFPPEHPGTTSARTKRWKLIQGELHDLLHDPGENWYASPSAEDAAEAEILEEALRQALEAREAFPPEVVAPSDSTLDELRALGYIQ